MASQLVCLVPKSRHPPLPRRAKLNAYRSVRSFSANFPLFLPWKLSGSCAPMLYVTMRTSRRCPALPQGRPLPSPALPPRAAMAEPFACRRWQRSGGGRRDASASGAAVAWAPAHAANGAALPRRTAASPLPIKPGERSGSALPCHDARASAERKPSAPVCARRASPTRPPSPVPHRGPSPCQ